MKNPLKAQVHHTREEKPLPSCGIVIFGASGDLAHRKLLPALYDLYIAQRLPANFFILGFARTVWTDEEFRKEINRTLKEHTKIDKKAFDQFIGHVYYRVAQENNAASYQELGLTIARLEDKYKTQGNVIYYLAIPPAAFNDTISSLNREKLIRPYKEKGPWTRVIFEKPFGHDLESARELNNVIHQFLTEKQIYRIDHYLGKETVQNILMFRFANSIFEPVWNRHYIDHVQIMAYETLGVEHRAAYYEHAGALRDMFQNHMFQLLTLVAMEPPAKFVSDQYQDEKAQVLSSLRPIPSKAIDQYVVRGQYAEGKIDGKKVPAYRQEQGIDPKSTTETFAAMKLYIDNWRWHGVPFYLRSGKRLNFQGTEILIQFKQIPHSIFSSFHHEEFASNILCFRIQPDEGISLRFEAKRPGPDIKLASINFNFDYKATFQAELMSAYERLLIDCMHGDQTLFIREDIVELSWKFLMPILEHWKNNKKVQSYASGSWGPKAANDLIERDDRKWRSYVPNYNLPTDGDGKRL